MDRKIVVTGAEGFIGKNLYTRLSEKYINVIACDYSSAPSTVAPDSLLQYLDVEKDVEVVFHQGACSDTTCYDPFYMLEKNFDYSVALLKKCLDKNIRLIYASSAAIYGDGPFEEREACEPKNIYAKSKYLFDQYAQCFMSLKNRSQIVGLRYFNVYGPHENHKEKMASVVYQFFRQIKKDNKIKIFKNSENYVRDFIYVDDIVNLNMHFFENKKLQGIYNCGTSQPRSFYDIAYIMKKMYNCEIEEISMPIGLKDKYQTYTCADNSLLQKRGLYDKPFHTLEAGIEKYVEFLENNENNFH